MAQTKTARSGSKGSKSGSRTSKRSSSNGSRAKSTGKASSQASSGGGSDQSGAAKVVERAKGPAMAGGAALVGLAGGLALSKNGRKSGGLRSLPRPKLNLSMPKSRKSTAKVLGGAAKEIAKGGYKVGQLTSEVRKVREAVETKDSDG